ncbi:phosphopantothenoylcysteine decarboxylase isoform X3 [Alligator sinensis]|uniref:Phosphopantothenoylcysteine decarboxylase isoform X3 n=1 Tax=Alligator sinensis TaxID=38654 RepID=A0A3Q0H7D8_ALLSI|nr:phosphopantothenoylcysteine decarboxylase isoform X3 [Alligator sinensis]
MMEPVTLSEPQSPLQNNLPTSPKKFHVLVGVTGSVAALKLPLLVSGLLEVPGLWKDRSDPVLHIDLRRWADLMLVAPLDANTLAKIANGICDNLLTCVIRAWDMTKPFLFCPAMNTAMWEHPITAEQIERLKGFGYTEIPCVVKRLVCGDEGQSLAAFSPMKFMEQLILSGSRCHGRSMDHCGEGEDDLFREGLANIELIP